MYLAGISLGVGLLIGVADCARAAEPVVNFSSGGDTLTIYRTDIHNAAVAVMANDQSQIMFCLSGDRASGLSRFLQSSRRKHTTVSIGGEPQKQIHIESGLEDGCGVLGPFKSKKATLVHQYLLGKISALPKKPPRPEYCPEQDFVNICLRAMTNFDDLEAWAKHNGWKWSAGIASTVLKTTTIYKPGLVQFSVSETRFSDVRRMSCVSLGEIPDSSALTACNPEFPLLRSVMPNAGLGQTKPPPFGGRSHQWVYETATSRNFVQASVGRDGQGAFFVFEKIKKVEGRP